MSTAQLMSLREKVKKQEELRHAMLTHIMNTDDLTDLHSYLHEGLQSFAGYAEPRDVEVMRSEICRKLLDRLDRGITMFRVQEEGQPHDPLLLIEAIDGMGADLDIAKLKSRITTRLRDDIFYSQKELAGQTMDYFYRLSEQLGIKLDDNRIEGFVYEKAEMLMRHVTDLSSMSVVTKFLDATTPVGRSYRRQSHSLQFIDFQGIHYILEV